MTANVPVGDYSPICEHCGHVKYDCQCRTINISTDGNDWSRNGISMREVPSRDMLLAKIAILESRNARLTRCVLAGRALRNIANAHDLGDDEWRELYDEALRNLKEARQALDEHGDLEEDAS